MTSKSARRLAESGRAGRALATAAGMDSERQRQRVETVGSLLRSIVTFVVVTLAVLTIMGLLGIPLGPLLTSAGIAGVALGFGAQSLVKDFLAGVSMILEDQYGVGDVIDTGEAIGTVEEVTLRITRLRDANGVTWYVRNGEIIRIATGRRVSPPPPSTCRCPTPRTSTASSASSVRPQPNWAPTPTGRTA